MTEPLERLERRGFDARAPTTAPRSPDSPFPWVDPPHHFQIAYGTSRKSVGPDNAWCRSSEASQTAHSREAQPAAPADAHALPNRS